MKCHVGGPRQQEAHNLDKVGGTIVLKRTRRQVNRSMQNRHLGSCKRIQVLIFRNCNLSNDNYFLAFYGLCMAGQDYSIEMKTTKEEILRPDSKGEVSFLSRQNYKLEEAVSDLIDNSIDASAKNVLIRFVFSIDNSAKAEERLTRIFIVDDGIGMDATELKNGMQLARQSKTRRDIGKYGVGLKTASMSQCKDFSVVTRREKGKVFGRRWDTEKMSQNWLCG